MSTLNTRTTKVVGFVRDKTKPMTFLELSALQSYFSSVADEYFLIIHDRDLNVDGEIETPHIHFVANMKNASRLGKFLREIAQVCGVSELAVSISKYLYYEMAIQYLIHKNDPDKYQYDPSQIMTNSEDVDVYLSVVQNVFNYEAVCACLVRSKCLSQVAHTIGFSKYHAYRNVIRDLFDDYLNGRLFYHGVYRDFFLDNPDISPERLKK